MEEMEEIEVMEYMKGLEKTEVIYEMEGLDE